MRGDRGKKRSSTYAFIECLGIEYTDLEGNARVMHAAPMDDRLALEIGQFLLCWGKMQHNMQVFCNNLREKQGNGKLKPNVPFKDLLKEMRMAIRDEKNGDYGRWGEIIQTDEFSDALDIRNCLSHWKVLGAIGLNELAIRVVSVDENKGPKLVRISEIKNARRIVQDLSYQIDMVITGSR